MQPQEEGVGDSRSAGQGGPQFPPYPGPFDIPVLVDDRKSLPDFEMTRCTYFTVQATDKAVDDWVAELRRRRLPFLLLGVTAVVHRPNLDLDRFENPADINGLFDAIEELEGVVVETAHIWLPNFLLDGFDVSRGDVFRLGYGLFRTALQFQRETISLERLLEACGEQREAQYLITMPEETAAFRRWSAEQIADARVNFDRQREDPELEVLDWYDERGNRHKA